MSDTNAHWAAAVTMVAATLASRSAAEHVEAERVVEEVDLFRTLVMMEDATAFVISAHAVVLTVSVGLVNENKNMKTHVL